MIRTVAFLSCLVLAAPLVARAQTQTIESRNPDSELTPRAGAPAPIKKYFDALRKATARTDEKSGVGQVKGKAEQGGNVKSSQDLVWEEDYKHLKQRRDADAQQAKPRLEGGIADVHVVSPGDTLWDLSSKYMNSPWLWPRVWSYNPHITNPHWIYPGQVIRFGPQKPKGRLVKVEPQGLSKLPQIAYRQKRLKIFRHTSFVTKKELKKLGKITHSKEDAQLLSRYDEAYLRFKRQGAPVRLGDRFLTARLGREISHPVTGKVMGNLVQVTGELTVVARGKGKLYFTGKIGKSWRAVERGNLLLPWEDLQTKISRVANDRNLKGYVLAAVEESILGRYQLAFIDKGSRDGVRIGNEFVILRRGDGYLRREQYEKRLKRMPLEQIGRIVVLRTKSRTSVGLLVATLLEVEVGDKVLMRYRK